jgi:tetratricopeptide (TPR) repeat protein
MNTHRHALSPVWVAALLTAAILSLALSPVHGADSAGEAHFQQALKAVSSKDYPSALGHFEAALSADAENMRFASEYRQAVIQAKAYDRCIAFFEKLVEASPNSSNAFLNFGFAYVDKIPDAGSITQVLLANKALSHFSKAIELKPSWIGYYTRGNSYLFWPKIFGRAPLGVADLEQALKIQKADQKRSYFARAYLSLGDGYWKTDDLQKARETWKAGLAEFPDHALLKARLERSGDELKGLIDSGYDPSKRVDTDLRDLWMTN